MYSSIIVLIVKVARNYHIGEWRKKLSQPELPGTTDFYLFIETRPASKQLDYEMERLRGRRWSWREPLAAAVSIVIPLSFDRRGRGGKKSCGCRDKASV